MPRRCRDGFYSASSAGFRPVTRLGDIGCRASTRVAQRGERILLVAKAVMFDFSGTLFRCEDGESWLRAVLGQAGIQATDASVLACATRLAAAGGQPGSRVDFAVPPHVASAWARRDLSTAAHRTAYTTLIKGSGLPWPDLADALYERHATPKAWRPYPDTAGALGLLADRAIPVAVVSNIGWDLRPVFRHHHIDHLVHGYVLSFEEGAAKPDPRIFHRACELLGHAPADVLMVGDDRVADAGATAIGCAFRAVDHLPPSERPHALLDAVENVTGK
jgi:HAD superfamily hydrolase (TIGR01493 family)